MLRLKGETDDGLRDDRLRADLEERDQITSRDAFPDGDAEWEEDERPGLPRLPLRGLAIAGATFLPTFLLVFFGIPYLLAPDGPIHAAIATVRSASEAPPAPTTAPPAPTTRSEPGRSGSANRAAVEPPPAPVPQAAEPPKAEEVTPPTAAQPPLPPAMPSSSRSAKVTTPTPPEPRAPEATPEPSLPPASRRGTTPHRPSGQDARASREARSGGDARTDSRGADSRVVDAKPASDGRDWTPAAAFTDRAAANRLASSIEKQGYPVEVRQDGSSSRPWVVWIGAQPSGGSRRR
jgi:hypothetical protein